MIEFDQANSEINALFWQKWNAESSAIIGYIPEIRWQGVNKVELPDPSKFWARLSKNTVLENQSALSNGRKRYTASGFIYIQLFCPISEARAFEFGQKLAKIARNSFRGKKTAGGIWFPSVTIKELENEQLWGRFDIVAQFEYDEREI